jgi:hypothetical protein
MLSTAVVLGGALLLGGGAAVAQDATPGGVDLSPNPDQCTQAPRTLVALQAITATPSVGTSAIEITSAADLPAGEEAPKEAIDGVVATVVENVACFNAGNYLALFGGMTDAYLLSQIGGGPYEQSFVDMVSGTPVALADAQQTQLLDTREFTLYPDGRVGVLVYYKAPSTQADDAVKIDLWVFKEIDGRWLLDESIEGLETALQDLATPAAG